MNFLRRPSQLLRTVSCRYSSSIPTSSNEFLSLGVDSHVVDAMRTAFPHIQTPSECQRGLLPAVLRPKVDGIWSDLFLKGDTGSGK